MITSRDNATLKLVRKLLGQRKTATRRGCSPPRARISSRRRRRAGIEPVELLVEGENVAPGAAGDGLVAPASATRDRHLPARRPAARATRRVLALWRLADPGNVGTLLRTADAFGASVALSDGCADPLSPKALRASAGAIFRVPLVGWDDVPGRRSRSSRTAARRSRSRPPAPVTLLLGAERAGLPTPGG